MELVKALLVALPLQHVTLGIIKLTSGAPEEKVQQVALSCTSSLLVQYACLLLQN